MGVFKILKSNRNALYQCSRTIIRNHSTSIEGSNGNTKSKLAETSNLDKVSGEDRYNELGIQMIPASLHKMLFPNAQGQNSNSVSGNQVEIAKNYLKTINVCEFKRTQSMDPSSLDMKLPKILGKNIEEHFYILGLAQCRQPRSLAAKLAGSEVPKMPEKWSREPGWTKYDPIRGTSQSVPAPEEQVMVFDIENIATETQYPAIATAASPTHWYSWVSPQLFTTDEPFTDLVSLGSTETQHVVIGHNVGYDRARVKEEYLFEGTANRWIDTLSLHSAVGGLSTQQRTFWMKYKKILREVEDEYIDAEALKQEINIKKWLEVSSMSSLADIVELYCGEKLSKADRDVFFKGTRAEVQDNFDKLMLYCANDVAYTYRAFCKLFPKFLDKCPHPASFAGMLHMGKGYLTTTSQWLDYIERCENIYKQNADRIEQSLGELADRAVKMLDTKEYENDPWLSRLDWSCPAVRYTQPKYKKDGSYSKNGEPRLVARQGPLKGYPQWYRELYDPKLDKVRVTQRARVTPYLLKLSWKGYPLYHTKCFGWTFVVPRSERNPDDTTKPLVFSADPRDTNFDDVAASDVQNFYYKVPHKDGDDHNCGDPLGKSYLASFADGLLRSAYTEAEKIIALNIESSYWMSSRQRVRDQFVIWQTETRKLGVPELGGTKMGVILPQSKVMGTITRRAVEPTWMTASNAKKDRLGSELKSQVVAPPGYVIIGADVDSQELWISSLLGDGQFQLHGGTPFGWMNLQGSKAAGTDLHSNTAKITGISRDNAKVFNYSRIYGAGAKHAVQLLLQFKPGMGQQEAQERASQLYKQTKGSKFKGKLSGYPAGFWYGGTESHMFNQLEKIAMSQDPRTPVLSCGIPEGLTPQNAGNDFLTSRINWVVQSSGVDYLHLLLVSTQYLIEKFQLDAQYLISIHDEIRFRVKKRDAERMAFVLQVANVWTRAIFAQRCCVADLPLSIAFFSAVDIDHCLRKEVDMDCVTPSNQIALAPGRRVSILETCKEVNGVLGTEEQYTKEPESVIDALEYLREFRFRLPPPIIPKATDEHLKWLKIQCSRQDNQILNLVCGDRSPAQSNALYERRMRQREAARRELNFQQSRMPIARPSHDQHSSGDKRSPNYNPLRSWSSDSLQRGSDSSVKSREENSSTLKSLPELENQAFSKKAPSLTNSKDIRVF